MVYFKFINRFFRNDYSYGFYLYHMIIVNIFIHYNLIGDIKYLFIVMIFTVLMSMYSWHFVENKFIKIKLK